MSLRRVGSAFSFRRLRLPGVFGAASRKFFAAVRHQHAPPSPPETERRFRIDPWFLGNPGSISAKHVSSDMPGMPGYLQENPDATVRVFEEGHTVCAVPFHHRFNNSDGKPQ